MAHLLTPEGCSFVFYTQSSISQTISCLHLSPQLLYILWFILDLTSHFSNLFLLSNAKVLLIKIFISLLACGALLTIPIASLSTSANHKLSNITVIFTMVNVLIDAYIYNLDIQNPETTLGSDSILPFFLLDLCSAHPFLKILYIGIYTRNFIMSSSSYEWSIYAKVTLLFLGFLIQQSKSPGKPAPRPAGDKEEPNILEQALNVSQEGFLLFGPDLNIIFSNIIARESLGFSDNFSLQQFTHNLLENTENSLSAVSTAISPSLWPSFSGTLELKERKTSQVGSINEIQDTNHSNVNKATSLEEIVLPSPSTSPNLISFFEKRESPMYTRHYCAKTNKRILLEVKPSVFCSTGNGKKYLLLALRDATKDAQTITQLENEKTFYKENIIASISHELCTPLNSNLAFLEESLEASDVPAYVKERLLRPALISAKLLSYLIQDVLAYSQLPTGSLSLNHKTSSISETVKRCVDLFRIKAQQKGVDLRLVIDKNVPLLFCTDHQRLSQIIVNLLNNAVKFTSSGYIQVSIMLTPSDSIFVSVKDTGIGMDWATQQRLTRRLKGEVLSDRVSTDTVGACLGLYISNKLVKLLNPNGKHELEFLSKKNQGSEFFFEVEDNAGSPQRLVRELYSSFTSTTPVAADERYLVDRQIDSYESLSFKNVFDVEVKRQASRKRAGPQVLIVDDEVFNIMAIEAFCSSLNVSTERAYNGEEAVTQFKKRISKGEPHVRLVLMDINMPKMDGYQACWEICSLMEKYGIRDVKIVGVTAYVSAEVKMKCYEVGMVKILNKPLSKEKLREVLEEYQIIR